MTVYEFDDSSEEWTGEDFPILDDDAAADPRPRAGARVGLLLLAAGSSTRMGENKMLLAVDGETLLRRAAKTALAAGLDPVLVITGHQREAAEAEVEDLPCRTVFNHDHATGIQTSVRAGIDALDGGVDAVIIMLADMPFVNERMLRRLVARYRGGEAPLVISRYGGEVQAPPMLYDRALFDELRVMQRRCGREVVQRHRDEAEALEWPIEALADIDTPDDLESARAAFTTARDPAGAPEPTEEEDDEA